MAIDTENKRRSVQAYTFGLMRPRADATIGTTDRPVVVGLFASAASFLATGLSFSAQIIGL